jgi:hypothetical protein
MRIENALCFDGRGFFVDGSKKITEIYRTRSVLSKLIQQKAVLFTYIQ